MLQILLERAENACELCQSTSDLDAYTVSDSPDTTANSHVLVCSACLEGITDNSKLDFNHMRCLTNSMWSTTPVVQVLSFRLLNKCLPEPWAQDALDMLFLEDDVKQWAEAGLHEDDEPTLDVNGVALKAGDSVTIIKDLDVKGANFTAKRGTPVRNIGLSNNPLHIEGRVNGQRIVIIAAYTKKL